MDSPLKTYKENLKNNKSIELEKQFINIYIKNKNNIKDKISFFNEEKQVFKLKKFLPGKIYLIRYEPMNENEIYDKLSIVFVLYTESEYLVGVNLNFLNPNLRVLFLESIYRLFKKIINSSEDLALEGKINLNIDMISNFLKHPKSVNLLTKMMGVKELYKGIGFDFAIRKYNIKNILYNRYIEYAHWENLPFVNTKSIVGASLDAIYKKYKRNI